MGSPVGHFAKRKGVYKLAWRTMSKNVIRVCAGGKVRSLQTLGNALSVCLRLSVSRRLMVVNGRPLTFSVNNFVIYSFFLLE